LKLVKLVSVLKKLKLVPVKLSQYLVVRNSPQNLPLLY
jgi:hypothetical protein